MTTIHFDCPHCGERLTGVLSRAYHGTHLDPPEPAELQQVEGCAHATAWDGADAALEEAAFKEADEADQAHYDEEIERQIDARWEREHGGEA